MQWGKILANRLISKDWWGNSYVVKLNLIIITLQDTKLIRKKLLVDKLTKFANIFSCCIIALYGIPENYQVVHYLEIWSVSLDNNGMAFVNETKIKSMMLNKHSKTFVVND